MPHDAIFIFRRDLRLRDNIGLHAALNAAEVTRVYPIFILDAQQLDGRTNSFRSEMCMQYMIESLIELNSDLSAKNSKLWIFSGNPHDIISRLLTTHPTIRAVYHNVDYTPFARSRDEAIRSLCESRGITIETHEDALLQPIGSVLTQHAQVYQKFSPYFAAASQLNVRRCLRMLARHYQKLADANLTLSQAQPIEILTQYNANNSNIWMRGGGTAARAALRNVAITQRRYNDTRNDLTRNTTSLSAVNKFGIISIRDIYWTFCNDLGRDNALVRQLYWRDFYYNLAWAYPRVLRGEPLKLQYAALVWRGSRAHFAAWCAGRTGFPIVDAAMRSLNTTGYMHNRGRLIVASFLVKLLLIDWREGERYFARALYDYDPAINNGNWQWVAGSGADSQPYFRIFNPWRQSADHDPNAEYIKRWLPELADVPAAHLHAWDRHHNAYLPATIGNYPSPIVDYNVQRNRALEMYSRIFVE